MTASTGPVATGPLVTERHVALEGSFARAATLSPSNPRLDPGATQTIHTQAGARIAFGITRWFELGAAVGLTHSAWSDTYRLADSPAAPEERWLVQGGLQTRVMIVGGERGGLRWQSEISLRQLDYVIQGVGDSRWTGFFGGMSSSPPREFRASDTVLRVYVLSGADGVWAPTRSLQFSLGGAAALEHVPELSFERSWTGTPSSYESVVPFESRFYFVGWGSASYTAGPVAFIGQLAGGTSALSRFGGTLVVRVTP